MVGRECWADGWLGRPTGPLFSSPIHCCSRACATLPLTVDAGYSFHRSVLKKRRRRMNRLKVYALLPLWGGKNEPFTFSYWRPLSLIPVQKVDKAEQLVAQEEKVTS
jgi:hypothetical protein